MGAWRYSRWARVASILLLTALLGACAQKRNAYPGPSGVSQGAPTVERGRVASVGWEAYDRYEDAELQAYVDRVAQRLAAVSNLSGSPLEVIIVDAPTPNATAGRGNKIAVTIGLMAVLLDEAEFAWVLSHEIGHLELKHPEQLIRRGVPRDAEGYSARAAASRAAETAADARAVELMTAAGYDLGSARRITERLAGGGLANTPFAYLASHPSGEDRLRALPTGGGGVRRVDAYLAALNGARFTFPGRLTVPIGDRVVVSPSLKLAFTPPRGYELSDTGAAIELTSPDGAVRIRLKAAPPSAISLETSLREVLYRSLSVTGADVGPLRDVKRYKSFGERDAITGRARITIGGVPAEMRLTLIEGDRRQFVSITIYPPERRRAVGRELTTLEGSFKPIDAVDQLVLDRLEIRIVQARSAEDYEALTARTGAVPIGEGYFRYINGLAAGARLRGGQKLKVVMIDR